MSRADNADVGLYTDQGGTVELHRSNVTGNGNYGAQVSGVGLTNAQDNWWGAASGPRHASNPGGTGDQVSNNVNFTPWLTGDTTVPTAPRTVGRPPGHGRRPSRPRLQALS